MESLDEVAFDLEVDGEEVRREVGRRSWERGAWATLAIAYEERARDGTWVGKVCLLRMKRARGMWVKHASITLRGSEAVELGGKLTAWGAALAGDGEEEEP